MKILFLGALFAIVLTVIMAQRPTFEMSLMGEWAAFTPNVGYVIPVAAKKDLVLFLDQSGSSLIIRRRNDTGHYQFANYITGYQARSFTTNGKWIASFYNGTVLRTIDENNVFSEMSYVPSINGFILSDDTFVGFSPSGAQGVPSAFQTFEFDSANNSWIEIPDTRLSAVADVNLEALDSTYEVTDTHLIYLDGLIVYIYQRAADKSWTFFEQVGVPPNINRVIFNGLDTLVCSTNTAVDNVLGVFYTYTKINDGWVEQIFDGSFLNYQPLGFIGYVTAFNGPNNLIVTAGGEGYLGQGAPTQGGKLLLLTRNSQGFWEPSVDLLGSPGLLGLIGFGLAINDYDIITPVALQIYPETIPTAYFTAPKCFTEPANVTCFNVQVDNCSRFESDSLYTINNPQCGAVSVNLDTDWLVDNQVLSAQFTFTRAGAIVSCNATVTCPAPPVAPTTPISSVTPTGSVDPPSSVAPIAESTPRKTVNSAKTLHFGIGAALVAATILLY